MNSAAPGQEPARRRGRWAALHRAGAAAAAALTWGQAAAAESAAPAPPPAAPGAYVDRVMEGVPALPELVDDAPVGVDPGGAPRTLRVESRLLSSSDERGSQSSGAISVRGAFDTANYGAISLDASARMLERTSLQGRGTETSFSLYQTAMPFGGGWFASQGLGVIQTLSPQLAGQQASYFVPTRLVRGVSTEWRNEGRGLTGQFSAGQTGAFSSRGQGAFAAAGSRVAALGFEWQATPGGASLLPPGWRYSAVFSNASVSNPAGGGAGSTDLAGNGLFQSLRWDSARAFVHGNLIASRNDDPQLLPVARAAGGQISRLGIWLDGAQQSGDVTHRWGVHRLAPDLAWQGNAVGANSAGGYYRWSRFGLRTQIEAQFSSAQPIDSATGGASRHQAGISLRNYVNQRLGLGGVAQISRGATTRLQAAGYAELQRSLVNLRLQAGFESGSGGVGQWRLGSDQAWVLPLGRRLSTSQAFTSTRAGAQDAGGAILGGGGTAFEVGASGGVDVGEGLTLDLNLHANLPLSSTAARLYNLSASGQWRISPRWSLGAELGLSRTTGLTTTVAASPIPGLPGTFTPYVYPGTSARNLWLTLRYDFQAGSARVPIGAGGRIGAGGGNIEGIVYFDDNSNGRRDALETRAANITVTLDGRYTTRTDAQGRFEFPFVVPGNHAVQVASDTLPLPWVTPSDEPLRIEVVPRETHRIEIGVTRERLAPGAP